MDLSKIGKCELCVLAKQVRAKKIEIGEAAKTSGTWDQELMVRLEACATSLESAIEIIRRFESRLYKPIRNLQDLVDNGAEIDESKALVRVSHENMIHETFQLLSYEAPESSP